MTKLLIILSCFFSSIIQASSINVDLRVVVSGDACNPFLNIALKNESNTNVTINSDALPWSDSFLGISMILYDWDKSILDKPIYLSLQESDENFTLKYNQILEGKIQLRSKFPDFDKKIKANSKTLHWKYVLFDIDKKTRLVKVGAVFLDKCQKD